MNAEQINRQIEDAKRSKIKIYPCNNLRASNIGHPCERYLYLLIRNWDEQEPHDVGLQNIFDLGNHLESHAIQTLKDAGLEVITPTQRSWKIENPLITGREDVRIKDHESGQLLPAEIKWLSPYEFEKLNAQSDFAHSRKPYIRGYPAQLLIYLYHFEKERGFFVLGNKLTGEVKAVDFTLDWDYADALLKKAERIYSAIESNDMGPLSTAEDYQMCDRCSLAHLCGAAINRAEAAIDAEGIIADLIAEKESLAKSNKRYEEIGDEIKEAMGDRTRVISGDYVIEKRIMRRAAYVSPECQYPRIFISKIEKLKGR